MDFTLTTEQEILRKSVRDFAEEVIKPVAREYDEKEEFCYDTMAAMGELGLFGVIVDERYGGQGMDYLSYIIATEEIARVDGSHAATVAAGNSLASRLCSISGPRSRRKNTCPTCAPERPSGASA